MRQPIRIYTIAIFIAASGCDGGKAPSDPPEAPVEVEVTEVEGRHVVVGILDHDTGAWR